MDKVSDDAQILSNEHGTIETLARQTNTAVATVQAVYLCEYLRLAAAARIKSYLPLLAGRSVRGILERADRSRAQRLLHAKPAPILRTLR
jgi:hypothetical protein